MVKDDFTIAERLFHAPVERFALERTPRAFALDDVARHRPRLHAAHDGDVGLVSGLKEAALGNAKQPCRRMAHQFHHALHGKHVFVGQTKHHGQRELNHRHARGCSHTTTLLLAEQVRRMVGGNGRDAAVGECSPQRCAVFGSFDGGIAFDARALRGIVVLREIEVSDTSLTRHVFAQELQFASGGEVGKVEARSVTARQLNSQRRRLETGFLAADLRMESHVGVVAVNRLESRHVSLYQRRIFTVRHNGKTEFCSCLKHFLQRFAPIHEHISR